MFIPVLPGTHLQVKHVWMYCLAQRHKHRNNCPTVRGEDHGNLHQAGFELTWQATTNVAKVANVAKSRKWSQTVPNGSKRSKRLQTFTNDHSNGCNWSQTVANDRKLSQTIANRCRRCKSSQAVANSRKRPQTVLNGSKRSQMVANGRKLLQIFRSRRRRS